jgi:hypothetical protein
MINEKICKIIKNPTEFLDPKDFIDENEDKQHN